MNRGELISSIDEEIKKLYKAIEDDEFEVMQNCQRQLGYFVRKVTVSNLSMLEHYADIRALVDLAARIAYADIDDVQEELSMIDNVSAIKKGLSCIDKRRS